MARPRRFEDDDVLARATELFWKHGSDSVTIRDLERALDLKAPSIYRRFHSKDELLVRCIDRYIEHTVGGRIQHFLDGADDPLAGLSAFFTSVLRPHPGESRCRGCLLTATSGSAKASNPEVRSAIARGFATIEAALRRQVERAVDNGQLEPDTDSAAVARSLLMSFQGLLVLARSGAPDLHASIAATFCALAPTG